MPTREFGTRRWLEELALLRRQVEQASGEVFNAVLCNRYASGAHYQGFHADDEPALGRHPAVASVTLGAERRFVVRSRDRSRKVELLLADGSLVLMLGAFQEHYVHAVPKTAKPSGLRLNLSFRRIIPTQA